VGRRGRPRARLADGRLGNARWRTWLVAHALIASGKAAPGFFYEMFHRLPALAGPIALPPGAPTVSIVPFPLRWHLTGTLARRHANLAPLGPNDGFGLLWDAIHHGPVVPVWGGSHYLRVPLLSQRFYGVFAWLAAGAPGSLAAARGSADTPARG
jgi:hypothetical protein